MLSTKYNTDKGFNSKTPKSGASESLIKMSVMSNLTDHPWDDRVLWSLPVLPSHWPLFQPSVIGLGHTLHVYKCRKF